jgi:hypothetical protein
MNIGQFPLPLDHLSFLENPNLTCVKRVTNKPDIQAKFLDEAGMRLCHEKGAPETNVERVHMLQLSLG